MPIEAPGRLELVRVPTDRRLYQLGSVGTVRRLRGGWRVAHAEASDSAWRIEASGWWRPRVIMADAAGSTVAEYLPRRSRRGGTLSWRTGRMLTLQPTSWWRERYTLAEGGHDVLTLDARTRGRRPVTMTVLRPESADPALLLLTAVLALRAATDTANSAGATVAATSAVWAG